jgi:hypothetical protein
MKDDVQELYEWISNECNFIPSTSAQGILNLLIAEWIDEHNCSETFVQNLQEIEPWLAFSAATLATECLLNKIFPKNYLKNYRLERLRHDFLNEENFLIKRNTAKEKLEILSRKAIIEEIFFIEIDKIISQDPDNIEARYSLNLADYSRFCSYTVYVEKIKEGATPTTVCKYIAENLFKFNFEDLLRWSYFNTVKRLTIPGA